MDHDRPPPGFLNNLRVMFDVRDVVDDVHGELAAPLDPGSLRWPQQPLGIAAPSLTVASTCEHSPRLASPRAAAAGSLGAPAEGHRPCLALFAHLFTPRRPSLPYRITFPQV